MSSVSISWERRAVRELRRLPRDLQIRVMDAVEALRSDPLQGQQLSGEWRGLRRLRISSARVVYGFDGHRLMVTVVRVGHRREVYRR